MVRVRGSAAKIFPRRYTATKPNIGRVLICGQVETSSANAADQAFISSEILCRRGPDLATRFRLFRDPRTPLVPYVVQQPLHLRFQISSERQQWQPNRTSEVAVEIHGVLYSGDAQFSD
jgi:hypothetical protein